jgi:hypothetical protein
LDNFKHKNTFDQLLMWSVHHAQRIQKSEGSEEETDHNSERKEGGEAVQEGPNLTRMTPAAK